jgi:hypothetical protein
VVAVELVEFTSEGAFGRIQFGENVGKKGTVVSASTFEPDLHQQK